MILGKTNIIIIMLLQSLSFLFVRSIYKKHVSPSKHPINMYENYCTEHNQTAHKIHHFYCTLFACNDMVVIIFV